jgi:hypothetical protein
MEHLQLMSWVRRHEQCPMRAVVLRYHWLFTLAIVNRSIAAAWA